MSLKIHPTIGIYDLGFKAAVKSLIKDGFISPELIDNLYTKCAVARSKESGLPVEEEKADIQVEISPWVWLCITDTVDCIKLKLYGLNNNGETLYTYGGYTRTCRNYFGRRSVEWRGHYGTLEQIRSIVQKQNPDKTFVTVCHRNSEGVLEPVGYVI